MKQLAILLALTPFIWAMECKKTTIDPNPTCPEQVIISDNGFRQAPADDLTITKAEIIGDCLRLEFTATGCDGSTWAVKLYDANAIKESYPVQRDLRLSLANQEECDAVIGQSVSFDLRPLRLDYDKILLNLTNSGDQLLYEY